MISSLVPTLIFMVLGLVDGGERPNIVYLLADDLGRHDCGFMGGTEIKTPHIDKLARAGSKFDAFYAQAVCSPTRAALLTGRYPMRHGLQVGVVRPWARYGLPLEERTLPQALQEVGYTTAIFGKWHLGHFDRDYLPTHRGFDRQYGHYNGAIDYFTHRRDGGFDWHRDDRVSLDEGYSTTLIADEAVKFIGETAGKKPFFLYVPFNAVHAPHQVPDKYLAPYHALKGDRQKYAGMLAAMDESVGRIVEAIEKAGVRGKTLFVFSSDNGGPQPKVVTDNGKFRAGKATLYEGGVRVVAFVTWDGHIPVGATIAEPMHMVDWFPTLVNLAGGKVESLLPLDGLDAWPMIALGKPSAHQEILLNTTPNLGAIRMGDWKLVVSRWAEDPDADTEHDSAPASKKTLAKPMVELFQIKDDPYETTNLAETQPARVATMRTRLDFYASQAVRPKSRPRPFGFTSPKVWGQPD